MAPLYSVHQQAVEQTFGQFAVRELLPAAGERDRSAGFPAPLSGRLRELDAMGTSLPVEYGGLGLDAATLLCARREQLAR
jgi:alkylation response protein AidB-like acyl-CoA dehydrogenase